MPVYHYQALDAKGKKRTGLIEAQTEKDAKDKLREQSVMVSQITMKEGISRRQNLKGSHLVTFTIQLSQLVSAGVPLYESLMAIEEQYRQEPFHRIILSLCEKIKSGKPLSEAMSEYPESFNRLYCAMIRAGESVGALEIVLDKLNQLLSKQMKLRTQIITAMVYPSILAGFCLLIIAMLLGFVVPSIQDIFADRKLNGFTEFILGLSYYARTYWWAYFPILITLIVYGVITIRSPKGQLWIERNFLKVPLIKTLMIQAALARFCRTMGTLQLGGLTMIDSLRISREVMQNVVLEEEMKKAENKIIEGSSLSAELIRSKWVPMMVSRMLAVGEESGSTVIMLNKIADMYEEDLGKNLERLVAFAQPAILIVMGGIIGMVMMAILLPLTDISAFTT